MARRTVKRTAKVFFDILLFVLIWFGEYAIHKWFEPFRRGFFCGDESLSYPFRESTFGLLSMAIIVFSVPPIVILAVELFKHLEPYKIGNFSTGGAANNNNTTTTTNTTKRQKSTTLNSNGTIHITSSNNSSSCHIGYRLLQCYKNIGYYLFGLGLILLATEIPKFAIGRLRPNFFTVCQPQLNDGTTCEDDINQGRYIIEYTCLGQNFSASTIEEMNQSFPSGHSSILFYSMVYLCLYLQASLSTRASKLLKHTLQFVFIMLALYVALTRVSDYWHHWSDVLAGIIMGMITAIIVALFMSDLFDDRHNRFASACITSHSHKTMANNSSASSTAKSTIAATALPAYTFGTLPYLHYTPHHAQYSQATYQNYGYVP